MTEQATQAPEATAQPAQPKGTRMTAKVKAEIVAKREAGVTLAELRKQYPQFTSEQIREALPPLSIAETKKPATTTRKAPTAKASTTKAKASAPAKPKATSNGTSDKARLELARKVVAARDKDGLSWLKIGAKFKLSDSEQPKAGASRARTLYRLVKGQDADTGPMPAKA
jgi:hypothetical protein